MFHNSSMRGVHKLRLQDLAFFDYLPPSVYIFYGIKVYKKLFVFLTTYPPPLVNVVCERPLTEKKQWNRNKQFIDEQLTGNRQNFFWRTRKLRLKVTELAQLVLGEKSYLVNIYCVHLRKKQCFFLKFCVKNRVLQTIQINLVLSCLGRSAHFGR